MEFFKTCFAGETLGLVQVGSQARGRFACHDKFRGPNQCLLWISLRRPSRARTQPNSLPRLWCFEDSSVTFVIFCLYWPFCFVIFLGSTCTEKKKILGKTGNRRGCRRTCAICATCAHRSGETFRDCACYSTCGDPWWSLVIPGDLEPRQTASQTAAAMFLGFFHGVGVVLFSNLFHVAWAVSHHKERRARLQRAKLSLSSSKCSPKSSSRNCGTSLVTNPCICFSFFVESKDGAIVFLSMLFMLVLYLVVSPACFLNFEETLVWVMRLASFFQDS